MHRYLQLLMLTMLVGSTHAESLYSSANFKPLIVDKRAYRVGDALTVLVAESTSAFSSADTNLDRDTSISGGIGTDGHDYSGSLEFGSGSKGAGKTSRASRLQAQITVTVTGLTQNGDLVVSGSKQIEVNHESQMFRIVGRVRRDDIATDNTVPSTRLADVKVLFSGDGDISDKQKPGLVARIIDWLGLP